MTDPARTLSLAPEAEGDAYRTPPHNIEAEMALIGAILVNNATYHRVSDFLRPEHFYHPIHQRLFQAIMTLVDRGLIADPVTLKNYFDHDGTLGEVGGAQYLGRLAASVVTIINAGDYGRTIYDGHLRRELIEIGTETVTGAYEHDVEVQATDMIEMTEKRLFDLAISGQADGGFQPFSTALRNAVDMAESAYKRGGKTSGVSTAFRDLDSKLGGLHASDLLILAGRPSMGKTALATNIAFNVAKAYRQVTGENGERKVEDGGVVAFFSLEMSAEQLATRVLAEESGVSGDKIRRGEVAREEFDQFLQASMRLGSVPLHIDDTPALSIAALRTRARRLKRQNGLHLVIVDYLQLLQGTMKKGAEVNRVQEVSEITRGLKALAKELEVPVIALSQLSRSVEQREDKRPQLSDLRESGSIEQDADVVMFVFRESYYLDRATPARRDAESDEKFNQRYTDWFQRCQAAHGTAEVIIAKQRHGPIGTIKLAFDGPTTRFSDLAESGHLPDQY